MCTMGKFLLLTVLGCCLVNFSHCCTVSAPEITLRELHPGCYTNTRSRYPDCVAAMHRYCARVTYPTPGPRLGVSREHASDRIGMSCVKSHLHRLVPITELRRHHAGCTTAKTQHNDCLAAIHRYCVHHLGNNFAGTSQEVQGRVQRVLVSCYKSTRKENVLHSVLKQHHEGCVFPNSNSDSCYSAASRWCQSLGHSGGITQEVNNAIMTVACYQAEFSNDVFTTRVSDFYNSVLKISRVCSLDFAVDQGKILGTTPEILKVEMSDNRGSDVTLSSSFEINKAITEKHSFTHDHSFTFGAEATFSAGIPFLGKTDITVSFSTTHSFSFTEENTRSITYSATSTMNVPPGKAVTKTAVITRAKLAVPWTAKIVNGLGSIKTIGGMWEGVNTYDFKVMQEDVEA